ncbi:MAG: HigA family addiction module antidote protein [Neisseriaceae bacterium]|nr:HigA family addiction module antidote protein [Neisseriaceae bacterium]
MEMHNPPHAGVVFKECLNGANITETAQRLGVTRATLSRIINGKQGVTADMAIKFAELLPNTDAEFWLRIQMKYDLWQAKQRPHNVVIPLSQPLPAMA